MHQKGFINTILILIVIILAGGLGYFTFIKKSLPTTPGSTPTQTGISDTSNKNQTPTVQTPTPISADKISGWKTFRSENLGFGFKYPTSYRTDFTCDEPYSEYSGVEPCPVFLLEIDKKVGTGEIKGIVFLAQDNKLHLSLDQLMNDNLTKNFGKFDSSKMVRGTISGKEYVQYDFNHEIPQVQSQTIKYSNRYRYINVNGNKYLQVYYTLGVDDATHEKIILTLNFNLR